MQEKLPESPNITPFEVPNIPKKMSVDDLPEYLGRTFRFKFHGDAKEYFGIWIVNILLTIATLSFYAPWAKVRRLRYFYHHTEFFDRFFDFTGLPTKILIGRLIALSIWGFFAIAGYFEMSIAAFGGAIIYLLMPWLLRATIRFRGRNSKFGNSRFFFSGSTLEAYKLFFLGLIISVFSMGLFFPVMIWFYKRYIIDHLYVGQLKFKLNNSWSNYMSAVLIPVGIYYALIMACLIFMVFGVASHVTLLQASSVYLFSAAMLFGMVFIVPLVQARIFITTWNNTTVGISQFKTDCDQWRYAWIVATNWIVKICTIGLMTPWAEIRLYRYQVQSLSLMLLDDPNLMRNMRQSDPNAIAEEISDIFDFDISL